MNEWSPGVIYSRPGTPNYIGRSYKWDENDKGKKDFTTSLVNPRTSVENRGRNFYQQSTEDISTIASLTTKSKKGGSSGSDPRFKRVVPLNVQNDACLDTEVKTSKPSLVLPEKEKSKPPVWNTSEFKKPENIDNRMSFKSNGGPYVSESNLSGPESKNIDPFQDPIKAVEKLSFSHDIIVKSFSKETLSDCTINTRNTSLVSEDLLDDYSNELYAIPSATKVKNTQNWILDQKNNLEKKQSVVTVIGQTQGQDALSSALREIDKRRKLVKELDKFAVCRKLTDTDKEKEISELVAQITSLSNASKGNCSARKQCECTLKTPNVKESNDKPDKFNELSDHEKNEDVFSESPTQETKFSSAFFRKYFLLKKKLKLYSGSNECIVKGKLQKIFSRVQYQWLFCAMFVISGMLCFLTYLTMHDGNFVSFDLFTSKPKPMTWYEKICMWIWELFRPSANYRRTSPWHTY